MHNTRMATVEVSRKVCLRRKPLGRRINDYINRQAANPRGPFAYLLAAIWRRDHAAINSAALDLLELSPGMRVADVGCGPGGALREIAQRGGAAVGLDISARMVASARRLNTKSIADGRVEVRRIADGDLGLASREIDRALSVHSIYFWKSPERMLAQLAAALKAGGRLVLVFTPDSPKVPARFRGDVYRFYTAEAIEHLLSKVGFSRVRTVHQPRISDRLVWIVAEKPPG